MLKRYSLSWSRPWSVLAAVLRRRRELVDQLQAFDASWQRTEDPALFEQFAVLDQGRRPPIYAMQKPSEFRQFMDRVRGLEPAAVVEIGTAQGGSLLALTRVAPADAMLISIDLPNSPSGGGYSVLRTGIYRRFARDRQRVVLMRRDSHAAGTLAAVRRLLRAAPIDLLFIDGDHSYAGVRHDYEMYGGLVRAGGLIALHDIRAGSEANSGVPRFWQELRQQFDCEEIIDPQPPAGYGIGLVRQVALGAGER